MHQHAHGGPTVDHDFGGEYQLPSGDIAGWHTYAIDWDAGPDGRLTWSVDGVVTRTLTAAQVNAAGGSWSSFQGPHAMILQFDVGGSWPGPPDSSTVFPARMLVDYVRAYRYPMN